MKPKPKAQGLATVMRDAKRAAMKPNRTMPLPFATAQADALIVHSGVNCRKCTACCLGPERVVLQECDDPSQYDTEPGMHTPTGKREILIRQRKNGECIYLDRKRGCTIYERRPMVCKAFRCDHMVAEMPHYPWSKEIRKAASRIRRGLPGK